MKGNNIDQLFRNKLDSHKSEAPSGAWNKIEAGLPQKKKRGIYFWVTMAASFTLIASIGWILLTDSENNVSINNEQLLSEQDNKPTEVTPEKEQIEENLKLQADQNNGAPIQLIEPQSREPKVLLADNLQEAINDQAFVEIPKREVAPKTLNIDLLRPRISNSLLLANHTSFQSININSDILLQSAVLSREEFEIILNNKNQKPGFLNSIVSVAKSMNNGAKALSEIRKNKNEFVTSDLKYGVETDSEDEDDDSPMNK